MVFTEVTWILLSIVLSMIVYYFMKLINKQNYWKNHGIAYVKPWPLVGNVMEVILFKKSIFDIYEELYFKFPNERVVGVYEMLNKPVLIVRDQKLIERILVKDFQHFGNHVMVTEPDTMMGTTLFLLKGKLWRNTRYKISPAFSTGKIKDMFTNILSCTDEMLEQIEKNLNKDYSAREAIAIYTMNVVANNVFGIRIDDKVTREKFVSYGSSIFNIPPSRFLIIFALAQFPKLASWLGIRFLDSVTEDYFLNIISTTLKQRENGDIYRNDFTQQLLSLKQLGSIEVKSKDQDDDYLNLDGAAPVESFEFSDVLLAGQAFQFFSAGFDPVLATSTYILYDLSRYPEIQERARRHTQEVLDKHGGYTYEALKDMTYLEQCIQETLRLYPIAIVLGRECTKSYYIPEEKLVIHKGQKVIIPTHSIQRDPKYYPDPEVYNPERFPPNTTKFNFTYLPFGDGPRICIGIRFALVVMKLAIARLITNYKFALSPKTEVPFPVNKQSILYLPKKDIMFNVSRNINSLNY